MQTEQLIPTNSFGFRNSDPARVARSGCMDDATFSKFLFMVKVGQRCFC